MITFVVMVRNSLLLIQFIFFINSQAYAQPAKADSLLRILQAAKEDTDIINANFQLYSLYEESDPDKALGYATAALTVAEKIKNQQQIARCFQRIGVAYDIKGNLDSCLFYLNRSASIFTALNMKEEISNVISDIAIAYYYRGNYELALRNHLKALEIRQQIGNKSYISKSLNNIGVLYRSKKDYANAVNYYRQSLAIKEELKDEPGILNTLINISSAFNSDEKYDSTYYYANKALGLAEKLHLEQDIYGSKVNMGAALVGLGKLTEAEQLLSEVEKRALEYKDKNVLTTAYEGLGDICFSKKNYSGAKKYFLKGLEIAKSNERRERMAMFYRKLSKAYREMGSYKQAFAYSDSSRDISHDLLNEENLRQMNEMSALYETAEKEKQIEKLNAQNIISAAESARRAKERNYFIFASVLFLGLSVLAYIAFTSNKKKKEQLAIQKQIIEKSLQEKEILLREIHHRVKNNLQVVSSLLSLQSNYITDAHALSAVKESRNRVQSMSLIHQNLYQENNLTGIDINDYIGKLCDNLFQSYNIQHNKIKLIKELQPLNLDVDIVVPLGLILNELITNSLKYAFTDNREGTIKIMLKEENNMLWLSVHDNGVGTPLKEAGKQNAFGYKMINIFLQKLKGEMHIDSEKGTKVNIEIKQYKTAIA